MNINLLQEITQRINTLGVLPEKEVDFIINLIEESPINVWCNYEDCLMIGNILIHILSTENKENKRFKLFYYSFLFYERSLRFLDDKNQFSNVGDYMFHRMRNSLRYLQIYYQKIALVSNFTRIIENAIRMILNNYSLYNISEKHAEIDVKTAAYGIIYHYTEQFSLSINDLEESGQPIPPDAIVVYSVQKKLDEKGISRKEILLGDNLDNKIYKIVNRMVENKNFDFVNLSFTQI